MKKMVVLVIVILSILPAFTATGTSVSWSIGKGSSIVDGVANAGPVTFTWTFDREVTYGYYVDGTPWVIWENGLQLVSVSPAQTTMDLPDVGSAVIRNGIVDATCINMGENRLPLDQRMGGGATSGAPWGDGADVWDGTPAALNVGDCIATGRGRRDSRGNLRYMIFTAVGVCNIVAQDMTGHYRPPIRMPAHLRAGLVTPQQVDVTTLPLFNVPAPRNWAGNPVTLDFSKAVATYMPDDADDLMNGPMTVCGIYSHTWYEPGSAMLNHNLSGTDAAGYQRNVADRFATCLYAAFNPDNPVDKRQRSLDKFIQVGLDYFYQYCLGYGVGNGGGGHPNGIEGTMTVTGAILGDSTITNAMKYQRFPGYAVGRGDTVVDMLSGSYSPYARTEACYLVAPAAWRSGDYIIRDIGAGAATLDECVIRLDMARDDHVLNNQGVPYTAVANIDSYTVITINPSFTWPMWSRNVATAARRSYQLPVGTVARLDGDTRIRKIMYFKRTAEEGWTESSWNDNAQGTGGVLGVYPALTAAELAAVGQTGTLTTGLCSRTEAESRNIILWDSWSVMNLNQILIGYAPNPNHGYLGIKLADNFHWLPFFHLFDDPGAPGKKMYEENTGYQLMVRFTKMQRDFGQYCWDIFATNDYNTPNSPTIQALTRYYLLNDTQYNGYCKTYDPTDHMWTDEVGIEDTRRRFISTECGMRSGKLKKDGLFTLDGKRWELYSILPAGIYLIKNGSTIIKHLIVQ